MNPEPTAQKNFPPEEVLPWDHLGGPTKDYLLKYFNEAMQSTRDNL